MNRRLSLSQPRSARERRIHPGVDLKLKCSFLCNCLASKHEEISHRCAEDALCADDQRLGDIEPHLQIFHGALRRRSAESINSTLLKREQPWIEEIS